MKIIGSYPKQGSEDWENKMDESLVSETNISSNDLILPIFVREGKNKIEPIKSMPGINRYSIDRLSYILKEALKYKILMVALFPYTPNYKRC